MKRLLVLGLIVLLVFGLVGCGYGGTSMSSNWSTRGLTSDSQRESWAIAANSVNGHATRRLDLGAEELDALHVNSSNSDGSITVTLTQDDIVEVFDISGEFYGNLDTSGFAAGRIRLRLDFGSAEGVNLFVNWAA